MIEIDEILKQGAIPKEGRKQLKQQVSLSATNAKKRELLRNNWFASALKAAQSGTDFTNVLNGLEDLFRLLDSPETNGSEKPGVKIGFSPGKDCKNLIIGHLMSAKKSLDVCVFTISDNDIADCLIRLHKSGVGVRIISDNEKAEDEGSDLTRMAESGIPVKIDFTTNHMHHKFSIADGVELLTGSYNWTRSAEQYNQENLIVFKNPSIATTYMTEFNRLWDSLGEF